MSGSDRRRRRPFGEKLRIFNESMNVSGITLVHLCTRADHLTLLDILALLGCGR